MKATTVLSPFENNWNKVSRNSAVINQRNVIFSYYFDCPRSVEQTGRSLHKLHSCLVPPPITSRLTDRMRRLPATSLMLFHDMTWWQGNQLTYILWHQKSHERQCPLMLRARVCTRYRANLGPVRLCHFLPERRKWWHSWKACCANGMIATLHRISLDWLKEDLVPTERQKETVWRYL